MTDDIDNAQKLELHAETATIAWKQLQYFFAGGKAIYVSPDLDLIEVAAQIASDNKLEVSQWMQNALLAPVTTAQARTWYEQDAIVWAVVVKPWVLVQELKGSPEAVE